MMKSTISKLLRTVPVKEVLAKEEEDDEEEDDEDEIGAVTFWAAMVDTTFEALDRFLIA